MMRMPVIAPAPAVAGITMRGKHLMLVTPHPDDESVAIGGLIQDAVRQGAHITVLQVTDGDNNPWPQRWLERRWRIRPRDRVRWGARRADEAYEALRRLGLPAASLQRLAWPDLGVGARLLGGGVCAIDAFAGVVQRESPDIIVLPDLHDRHPDHAACHVLVRLALARRSIRPECLTYRVHGRGMPSGERLEIALDAGMQETKRQAILAHRTQVALARRRLLAKAGAAEPLWRLSPPEYTSSATLPVALSLPWNPRAVQRPWLRLVLAHPDGAAAWPWRQAPIRRVGTAWGVRLPREVRRRPVFVRLESSVTTPWIFDHWGWHDLTAMPSTGQAGE